MGIKAHINNFIAVCLLTGLTVISAAEAMAQKKKNEKPNIVLILADDLGYSDLGCYGGEINTPNLDRIAKQGMQFTQFYNVSRCCPTRASLLTGLYNHDAGIGDMTTPQNDTGYRGYLGKNTVTIAEVLKQSGYHTAMTGKWHVSNTIVQGNHEDQMKWLNHQAEHPLFSPADQYPVSRGFEKFYGTIWGVIDFYDPFSLVEGTTPVKSVPKNYYHTDAINDKAAGYVREFSKTGQPFFLYIAHNAPHWPIQAPAEDIEKYKDTYKAGWDIIRENRYKKMVSLGLIDPEKVKLSPRNPSQMTWEANPNKEWDARAMAVHAAMIDRMDQGIGRVIKALEETGEMDNTIFVFLSDNGASAELSDKYGPGFDRPGQTRDGQKISYATDKTVMPGPQTTFFSIGPAWANVSNTPFRLWKSQSLEGGVHTPMIVSWPAGIKAKGSKTAQIGHVMDFMATFIDVAGVKYPREYNGNAITPLEGKSLAPLFAGNKAPGHVALFNEHEGSKYVRVQNWKLVVAGPNKKWQLYDLSRDYSELNDLAAQYPDKVKELSEMWNEWAVKHHVLPKPSK
ncbi:arylsulfatase [Pedobacter ginsengisoli]|uniref:arylsulfatase n=1 Tax=Pedobacter ginsengisoli TaxID=363852 RepID=UPI00254AF1BA|nr:arylsulfatase [Pedobacter ginsengisoli]